MFPFVLILGVILLSLVATPFIGLIYGFAIGAALAILYILLAKLNFWGWIYKNFLN